MRQRSLASQSPRGFENGFVLQRFANWTTLVRLLLSLRISERAMYRQLIPAQTTLAGALNAGRLVVPPYQRDYSWKPSRVRKLFADFENAMTQRQDAYFVGIVMLTPGDPPCVIDGQQRLATTTIFLSAVRDAFLALGKLEMAKLVEDDYLFRFDLDHQEYVPRLRMNVADIEYVQSRILDRPAMRETIETRLQSHRRIEEAAQISQARVSLIMAGSDSDGRKVEALNAWIKFLRDEAVIMTLTPPNAARAFQMYKTLNDRAQRSTQADMIKNHLFEQAGDSHIHEAQAKWASMQSTIEGVIQSRGDDPLLIYLHQVSIALHGPVKVENIFDLMESQVSGRKNALAFLDGLANLANDYAAIVTPSAAKWGKYDARVRRYVEHISQQVKLPFIRPLMLAVAARFSPKETHIAYRAFVSWLVRYLIAGGNREASSRRGLARRRTT